MLDDILRWCVEQKDNLDGSIIDIPKIEGLSERKSESIGDITSNQKSESLDVASEIGTEKFMRDESENKSNIIRNENYKSAIENQFNNTNTNKIWKTIDKIEEIYNQISEVIKISLIASLSKNDEIQFHGLQIILNIVKTFGFMSDPQLPDQLFLEQYILQVIIKCVKFISVK